MDSMSESYSSDDRSVDVTQIRISPDSTLLDVHLFKFDNPIHFNLLCSLRKNSAMLVAELNVLPGSTTSN